MKHMLLIKIKAVDIPFAGDWVQRACIDLGMDKTSAMQVMTCVVEGINNCVEHAYSERDGEVTLSVWEESGEVRVRIVDHGQPIPLREIPDDVLDFQDPHAESGRGLAIMRAWMDEVTITHSESTNTLFMAKRLQS